jgi:hypothetical protein
MRRAILAGASIVTLAVPGSLALAGSGPASAAANVAKSSVSCSQLTGTETGNTTISDCTPVKKGYVSATAPTLSLASGGGTVTWSTNNLTTIITVTFASGTSPKCAAGSTNYVAKGKVTGGTAKYTHKGDAVKVSVCLSSGGAVTLTPGSKALL